MVSYNCALDIDTALLIGHHVFGSSQSPPSATDASMAVGRGQARQVAGGLGYLAAGGGGKGRVDVNFRERGQSQRRKPPSVLMTWPVIQTASSVTSQAISRAGSSGTPQRCCGNRRRTASYASGP